MLLSCHVRVSEWIYTLYLPECQGTLSHHNGIQTHNNLVRKRILSYLAKLAKWLNGWVFVCELSRCGFESCCRHPNFHLLLFRVHSLLVTCSVLIVNRCKTAREMLKNHLWLVAKITRYWLQTFLPIHCKSHWLLVAQFTRYSSQKSFIVKINGYSLRLLLNLRFRILELQNRVTQNDVTLWVTNSKFFIEILLSSY